MNNFNATVYQLKEITCKEDYPSNYTVLDFETTGLYPETEEIIQICASKYRSFSKVDEFLTLVNPDRLLSERTISVTGITDNDVRKAPHINELLGALMNFIGDDIIIGHYVTFDIKFYLTNLRRYRFELNDITYVDTVRMARRYIKGLENYKLPTLKAFLNIEAKSHLADQDCYVCNEVYKYCMRIAK